MYDKVNLKRAEQFISDVLSSYSGKFSGLYGDVSLMAQEQQKNIPIGHRSDGCIRELSKMAVELVENGKSRRSRRAYEIIVGGFEKTQSP
jgi:hypothetical protein